LAYKLVYAKKRKAGLCAICPLPAENSLCKKHLKEHNAYCRRRYRKLHPNPEPKEKLQNTLYARRRAAGICTHGFCRIRTKKSLCKKHREAGNARRRYQWKQRNEADLESLKPKPPIQKCPHGVYMSGESVARYCSICNGD
jgi:hypothetical protein